MLARGRGALATNTQGGGVSNERTPAGVPETAALSFLYHFWMAGMKPLKRRSGNQYMHMETEYYRQAVRRKLGAHHCFLQINHFRKPRC